MTAHPAGTRAAPPADKVPRGDTREVLRADTASQVGKASLADTAFPAGTTVACQVDMDPQEDTKAACAS